MHRFCKPFTLKIIAFLSILKALVVVVVLAAALVTIVSAVTTASLYLENNISVA